MAMVEKVALDKGLSLLEQAEKRHLKVAQYRACVK
jgi:hypothetical protein